jgi:hypothetical protein
VRALIAALLLVVVGIPVMITPHTAVALVAGGAVALCALGVATRVSGVFTAGLVVATGEHALAIALADGRARFGAAIVAGVAMAWLLEVAHLDRNFRAARLGPGVLASRVAHGAGAAVAGAAATLVLLAVARALAVLVRVPWAPVLAAAGALVVLGAVATALRHALAVTERA